MCQSRLYFVKEVKKTLSCLGIYPLNAKVMLTARGVSLTPWPTVLPNLEKLYNTLENELRSLDLETLFSNLEKLFNVICRNICLTPVESNPILEYIPLILEWDFNLIT